MNKIHSSEKGQILILLVLVVIGLLGFTALAIDGGMIFADRRYTQSAADAASLAGAGAAAELVQTNDIDFVKWLCSSSILQSSVSVAGQKAIESALANDYQDVREYPDIGIDGQVNVTCYDEGEYIDVEVTLFRQTNTSFVHLFTGGEMRNTVYSKTRVRPVLKAGSGAAIVSLGLGCKQNVGGVEFWGNTEDNLINSGVWSNSCVDVLKPYNVTIDGQINCHEGYTCPTDDYAYVNPESDYHPLTDDELYPGFGERCTEAGRTDYGSYHNGSGHITPGNYSLIKQTTGGLIMDPGLYCISGDLELNTNSNNNDPECDPDDPLYDPTNPDCGIILAEGVTIYFTGSAITLNGGAGTILTAPNSPDHPPINGAEEDLLLYVPPSVTAKIYINGNADNVFGGTLYAPSSPIEILGNSTSEDPATMNVSIIGLRVDVSGNSNLVIEYMSDMDATRPSYLQVQK